MLPIAIVVQIVCCGLWQYLLLMLYCVAQEWNVTIVNCMWHYSTFGHIASRKAMIQVIIISSNFNVPVSD